MSTMRRKRTSGEKTAIPRHDAELESLARIEGQIRGIKGMIVEGRYCIDVLTQTRAVHAALRTVERNILAAYLQNCVVDALSSGDKQATDEKVAEILTLFDWENGKKSGR